MSFIGVTWWYCQGWIAGA